MTKNNKASALVVSLVIMGLILMSALALSLASLRERTISIGSNRTAVAYQNAETGVEKAMNEIIKNSTSDTTVADIRDASEGSYYTLEFKDVDGNLMNDADRASDIRTIRSVGRDAQNQNQRAIEAAVAATCANGATTKVVASSSDEDVSESEIDTVKAFVDNGGIVAGFMCDTSDGNDTTRIFTYGAYFYVDSARFSAQTGSQSATCAAVGGAGTCFYGSGNTLCDDGWKLVGYCD